MSGAKKLIFEQFALVGQALSSGHRLELLDLLVQGERSVDALARASGLTFANASQHLLQLRRAGLVTSRRDGKRVIYALSDPQVWDVVRAVRAVAERNLASVGSLVRQYYTDRDSLEPISRPAMEYAAGHLPGAVSIPLDELAERLDELPSGIDIVACCRGPYCVYAYDALELLRPNGFSARRLDGGFSEWLAADLPVVRT